MINVENKIVHFSTIKPPKLMDIFVHVIPPDVIIRDVKIYL